MNKQLRTAVVLLTMALVVLAATGCTAKIKKSYHLSRANRYYNAGHFEPAEIEYINVLRYDPTNAAAYGRLGLLYYDEGRLQRALFFLSRGSRLDTNNLDLRVKLGFIFSSMGQFTQAVAQANYVLQKRPQDDEAPILLAESSVQPKAAAAARQELAAMAGRGDRAPVEVALGNLALRDHDLAAAGAAYKKAQSLDPKSPAVNVGLGMLAWAEGNPKQAEPLFRAAAEASPPRSPRRMQYVRFEVQSGNLETAREFLNTTLKAAPDYVPAVMMLAEIAAAEKKYDECTQWLTRVLQLDEDNFDALLFQGQLDLARGEPEQAVTDLERMARIYPQVPQVHYQLGAAYLAAENLTKAADSLNRALELNPNYIEATLLLARVQVANGNAASAVSALERLRQKQPRLIQAQLLLADAYRLQNRLGDALQIYTSLESSYPTNLQVRLLHGAALLQLHDQAGARKAFEDVRRIDPDDIPAIEQLVDLDLAEGKFAEATTLVAAQVRKHPKEAALGLMAAKIQLAEGERGQAENTLSGILSIQPDNLSASLLLAQIHSDANENGKALADLNAVMAKNPRNVSGLMLAAQIYEANKDYRGAAAAYEKLLTIDSKFSPALNNLAYLYSERLNKLDRAYELAQQARTLAPFDPSTADTLGWICYKRGAYQDALGLLQESASKPLGTTNADVQFHLGMANYMSGNEAAARTALQSASQLGTDFAGRAQCERCLAILKVNPATATAAERAMLEKAVSENANDPVALVRLAGVYQRAGDTDKAIAAYEALARVKPKDMDSMANLIRLYALKDPQKAYDAARNANKLAPYNVEISHLLGRMAFQAGDYPFAASVLQQAAHAQPNDASLLFDYGQAAYSVGKTGEAQAALQNALTANLSGPAGAQAHHLLEMMALAATPAQAASAQGRINEALKADPKDVAALMAQAAAGQAAGNAAMVESACEKVLGLYPGFVPAQWLLAQTCASDPGKLDRAYTLAANLHSASPDDFQITKLLGIVLVKRADYSHAVSLLQQCALKSGSDAEVFYYLGAAQFQLKNRAESKANLQKAIALNPSGPTTELARQMLGQMK